MNNQVMVLDIPATISGNNSLVTSGDNFTGLAVPPVHFKDFAILKGIPVVRYCRPVKTDYYNISLCLNGGCKKTVGSFLFEVYPASIHLIGPGDLHSYEGTSEDFHVYQVLFKKEFLSDSLLRDNMLEHLVTRNDYFAPIYGVPPGALSSIRAIYDKIHDEVQQSGPFHLQIIRLLVIELLYEVNRVCEKCLLSSNRHSDRQYQLAAKYKKLINLHFKDLKTVQEYASLLFVSAKYLTQVIKSQVGENALHLLHQRVYEEAQYLLGTTTLSIKEIADQLNFESSSHFSRFFKRYCGVNPVSFRSMYY